MRPTHQMIPKNTMHDLFEMGEKAEILYRFEA